MTAARRKTVEFSEADVARHLFDAVAAMSKDVEG